MTLEFCSISMDRSKKDSSREETCEPIDKPKVNHSTLDDIPFRRLDIEFHSLAHLRTAYAQV